MRMQRGVVDDASSIEVERVLDISRLPGERGQYFLLVLKVGMPERSAIWAPFGSVLRANPAAVGEIMLTLCGEANARQTFLDAQRLTWQQKVLVEEEVERAARRRRIAKHEQDAKAFRALAMDAKRARDKEKAVRCLEKAKEARVLASTC